MFNYKTLWVGLFCVSLGIILAVSFKMIRYTEFIPPTIEDIDPAEAYQNILDNPSKYILIDVRSEGEYARAHASSSINLPIHYLYDGTHGLQNEKGVPVPRNTDQEISLLCTGGRLAGVAYSYLEHYGYRNIKRVSHGLAGWNDAGLPLISVDLFSDFKEQSFNGVSEDAPLDKPYVAQ